jgi:hypothetical protein
MFELRARGTGTWEGQERLFTALPYRTTAGRAVDSTPRPTHPRRVAGELGEQCRQQRAGFPPLGSAGVLPFSLNSLLLYGAAVGAIGQRLMTEGCEEHIDSDRKALLLYCKNM